MKALPVMLRLKLTLFLIILISPFVGLGFSRNNILLTFPKSRTELIRRFSQIEPCFQFKKGKDVSNLPYYYANCGLKKSVGLIGEDNHLQNIQWVSIIDKAATEQEIKEVADFGSISTDEHASAWLTAQLNNIKRTSFTSYQNTLKNKIYTISLDYSDHSRLLSIKITFAKS